ncbi:MAG: cytochrome b [Alphaproteobacteria bacterium MarineAlpha6_Bin4]|nr:MAG: cytochrome b [Alphaproteobacteria bacterium MarineAlpha6_Bin4]|tara:strand:- start:14829 stop:16040 length:1212 start_codon:yes stop_codon:yes gene_type:complete
MAKKFKNKTLAWLDYRLPIFSVLKEALVDHPTPRNLNYWWNFGSLAGITLIIMIVSGLMLSMHYVAHVDLAFDSVEHIMRDVNYGWLIRYIHSVGASMFFLIVYIHISRGLYYGSYKSPREVLWWLGIIIFLLMIASAFLGYTLPWGQMSFWGATVITNLFSAIPLVGDSIVTWLWGGFSVDNPTLNRFYSLHFLIPFVIVGIVFLHIVALHKFGSNNPTGIDITLKEESIPFHPYYTIKDLFGLGVFFIIFGIFVFFLPNSLGHPDNYIPADPLVTPEHIVPEWYFLPFYAILRAIPFKLLGVLAMLGSILILFALPWLDTCKVRSCRFRPIYKQFYWIFIVNFFILGWVGSKVPEGHYLIISRICTGYYFIHFLIILPLLGFFEKTLPVPANIFKEHNKKK